MVTKDYADSLGLRPGVMISFVHEGGVKSGPIKARFICFEQGSVPYLEVYIPGDNPDRSHVYAAHSVTDLKKV